MAILALIADVAPCCVEKRDAGPVETLSAGKVEEELLVLAAGVTSQLSPEIARVSDPDFAGEIEGHDIAGAVLTFDGVGRGHIESKEFEL